jgi:hypothetical protein
METIPLNENGVYASSSVEIVGRHGRSFAEIRLAYCDDGQFRFGLGVQYSYGGFSGPNFDTATAFASLAAARNAALEALLAKWPKPFASDPASVHEELRLMREQVASQLRQPTLF